MLELTEQLNVIVPLTKSVREELNAAITAEPMLDVHPGVHLASAPNETVPNGLFDLLSAVAARYTVFETSVIDIAKVTDTQGTFLFHAAVVGSDKLNSLRSDITEAMASFGIELLGTEDIAFHIPLSTSSEANSIDSSAILNTVIVVEEFQILALGEVYSFRFDPTDSVPYFVSSTHRACNGHAVVRAEDDVIMSCHESETQARDALDRLLRADGARQDEKLINAETDSVESFQSAPDVESTSSMVALWPTNGSDLNIAGGLPADDIHVTVLYLGKYGEDFDGALREDIKLIVLGIAKEVFPENDSFQSGTYEHFGNPEEMEGQVAVVVVWDEHENASRFRELTELRLGEIGVENASQHKDFKAHTTLIYMDQEQALERFPPGTEFEGSNFIIGSAGVKFGPEKTAVDFDGDHNDSFDGDELMTMKAHIVPVKEIDTSGIETEFSVFNDPEMTVEQCQALLDENPVPFAIFTANVSADIAHYAFTELGASFVGDAELEVEFEVEELEAIEVEDNVLTLGVSKQISALAATGRTNEFETLMVIEGKPTGDRRQIELGALTWRDLPLPFMFNADNTGHGGSSLAGVLTEVWREEYDGYNVIWAKGLFDNSPVGAEAKRMYAEGMMRGVSVDMDQVTASETFDADDPESFMFNVTKARIMGVTSLPFPAFQEAAVWLYHDPSSSEETEAMVASGVEKYSPTLSIIMDVSEPESLVASGAVTEESILARPPAEWFDYNPMGCGAYPVEIDADGHVHGYVASFQAKAYHIGYLNKDVSAPKTRNNYAAYRTGSVFCDDGSMVKTGRLTINTVHPKLAGEAFNKVQAFYDHTGSAIADVVAFDDDFGIFISGAVRPGVTSEQLRIARASDWSPDWRRFDGDLQMVAILGVNLSGFIVDGLVASGGEMNMDASTLVMPGDSYIETDFTTGEVCTAIGCGKVRPADVAVAEILDRMNEMQNEIRELNEFKIAEEIKSLLISFDSEDD